MKLLFYYLIFPGCLFASFVGLMAGWVDRKVTARLQWRVGPPWHQNFTDLIKLLGKETIIPAGTGTIFLLAPYIGVLSAGLVSVLIGCSIVMPMQGVVGDVIVAMYLLVMPGVALLIGASASRNPLASVGASREMKLMIAYELPFILNVIAMVIKSGGALQLGYITTYQLNFGSNIWSVSGMLAFISMVFCMQAKLGVVPFDASEADQEIMGGVLIEYSGAALALFKLAKALMLYSVPMFLIVLFMGKDVSLLFVALKYVSLLVVIILIKNTNPRLRIDQAVKFFWRWPLWLAVGAVVLAVVGR